MRKLAVGLAGLLFASPILAAPPPKAAPASPPEAKKDAPKMIGQVVPRKDGGYLGITIEDGKFRVYFYDVNKKPVRPDAARIAIRWDAKYKQGWERVVLTPLSDGASLGGGKPVRPPHTFLLFVTLLRGEEAGAEAFENYTVNYRPD